MLALERKCNENRCALKLCDISPELRSALSLMHLDKLFEAYTSQDEAIASFGQRRESKCDMENSFRDDPLNAYGQHSESPRGFAMSQHSLHYALFNRNAQQELQRAEKKLKRKEQHEQNASSCPGHSWLPKPAARLS